MSERQATRIMIVDDHEIVRAGLRLLLERRAGHDFPRPWPVKRLVGQSQVGS